MRLYRKQSGDLPRGLSAMHKPQLSHESKARIRASLLSNLPVRTTEEMVPMLQRAGMEVRLNPMVRVRVKERMLAKLEDFSRVFRPMGFYFMRMLSSTMIFALFVGSVFFYGTYKVQAQTVTRLVEINGQVYVIRDGHRMPAQEGMLLMEDDVIRTEQAAQATIVYYDDSVSRLDAATEVKLEKLYLQEEDKLLTTQVVLSLHKGDVWVNVPSLASDESTFWVEAGDYMAEVVNRGAFHVKAGDIYELGVFESVVYVADKENNKQPVVNGYKLSLNAEAKISPISEDERKVGWVRDNLDKDEQHLDGVKNKLIAEVRQDVQLKSEFEGRLSEYELLLADNKSSEAKDKLIEIRQTVEGLLGEIEEVSKSDPEQAKVLREELNKDLALHHRILTLVSSDIESIEGKNVLYEVKVALADTEEEKKEVESQKATEVLAQVADVLAEKSEVPAQQLDEYVAEAQKIVREDESTENASLLSVLETQRNAEVTTATQPEATTVKPPVVPVIVPPQTEEPAADDNLPPQFQIELEKDKLLEESQ